MSPSTLKTPMLFPKQLVEEAAPSIESCWAAAELFDNMDCTVAVREDSVLGNSVPGLVSGTSCVDRFPAVWRSSSASAL